MGTVLSPAAGATRRTRILRQFIAILLLAACGDGGGTGTNPNPVPELTSVDPAGINVGTTDFTLAVDGSGFIQGSVVQWNGRARPTTFVSATRLTAQIRAEDADVAGLARISVFNPAPGGGASNALTVDVSQAPPSTITSLEPDTIDIGFAGNITIQGTGFVPGSRAQIGSVFIPPTTVISPNELRFTLSALNFPIGGFFQVAVITPDGVPSNPLTLAVRNPVPVVTSYTPDQTLVEGDSQVVRFTGTGFTPSTRGYVNGNERVTRRISASEVHVVLVAADLRTTGPRQVSLINNAPGGGGAGGPVTVVNPAPTLSAATPSQAEGAADSLVVRLGGTGFVEETEVRLNGSRRESRRISRTEMEAVLTADDLSIPGTYALTAFNPGPGGGVSGATALAITAPTPVLTTLPTGGATAGGGGFTLTVHGRGFVRTSRIRWNGAERTTRWLGPTRLEMDVTAADVATPRTATVTVSTPGAGTSSAAQIAVRAPGSATVTDTRSAGVPAREIVWDAPRGRIYASLGANAAERANTVVAIDPTTGAITGSVEVGGDPGALAISDDESTLWVALDATREVLRLSLPSLTPGTRFSTGAHGVEDLLVMPGHPGTVVASLRNACCSPRHEGVAVYDNGVRRPRATDSHTGANRIVFGESAAVVYGYGNEGSPAHFFTIRIQADGAVVARQSNDVLSGANGHIRFGGGRVYSTLGIVADAAQHRQLQYIPDAWAQSAVAVDVALGRVFYVNTDSYSHTLQVFDVNTFQRLGTADVNGGGTQHGFTTRQTLLRWGTDGLALSDGTHIHFFRTALAGP